MADDKIARICWNTQGWRKPSGKQGKSKNKKAYEFRVRYGHEEWLLDTTKLIDGWHYAYLQPIGLHRDKYVGQTFNISLYSINDEKKSRWWVGRILGVEVIPAAESRKMYGVYKAKGWLKEMENQLAAADADVNDFRKLDPDVFSVVRYRPESMELLDSPLEFSADDPAVAANYYILLNQIKKPNLLSSAGEFSFIPGHNQRKLFAKQKHYESQSADIDLVHNKMQENLYRQLAKEYGEQNVGTELDTGNGAQIDMVVRDNDKKLIFFEIKTSYSTRLVIREAIGQLLEYAYFPKAADPKKLVVVSPNKISAEVQRYLIELRKRFGVPIFYRQYNPDSEVLETVEH